MKANFPGELIHLAIFEIPTVKDGNAIFFMAVDNFSRYCFHHLEAAPFTFEKLTSHIDKIFEELKKRNDGIKPTFIMAYGESMKPLLEDKYKETADFIFNTQLAEEMVLPAAGQLFADIDKRL